MYGRDEFSAPVKSAIPSITLHFWDNRQDPTDMDWQTRTANNRRSAASVARDRKCCPDSSKTLALYKSCTYLLAWFNQHDHGFNRKKTIIRDLTVVVLTKKVTLTQPWRTKNERWTRFGKQQYNLTRKTTSKLQSESSELRRFCHVVVEFQTIRHDSIYSLALKTAFGRRFSSQSSRIFAP